MTVDNKLNDCHQENFIMNRPVVRWFSRLLFQLSCMGIFSVH